MIPQTRTAHLTASSISIRQARRVPSRALSSVPSSSSSSLPSEPTGASSSSTSTASTSTPVPDSPATGYYKITLTRSAIGLGERKKATLAALGIHRRMQTVFHPHRPEFAGKILAVKELVKVENVRPEAVRSKTEIRRERRPPKGFEVVGRLKDVDIGTRV